MATQTTNLGLNKPEGTDYVQIDDFNSNSDILDASIGKLAELRTNAKSSLVAAVNEAMISGGTDSPYINTSNGHWMQWNNTLLKFEDTGIAASGKDGTKWWSYAGLVTNMLGKLLISKKYLPAAVIGDYVLVTLNDAGVTYTITGETESDDSWVVKLECILKGAKGADGITPNIGANGNWFIGDTDTGKPSRGVDGEKGASGKNGARGRGWYQYSVKASDPQVFAWTGLPAAPKWGEGDWLYNPDNGNVGLCTRRTNNADGSGQASVTYTGTLKGPDGITPYINSNGNWFIGEADTGVAAKGQDGAKWFVQDDEPQTGVNEGDYWLDTGTNDVYRANNGSENFGVPVSWKATGANLTGSTGATGATGSPGPKGIDGTTPHIGVNGNWYIDDTDTGVKAKGTDGITPNIGANGNWYLGETDTGKPSRGEQGPGAEVFYIDLEGNYPNYTCPVAMADIKAAYEAGKVLACRCAMGQFTATLPLFIPMPSADTWIFSGAGALHASVSLVRFPAQSLTIAIINGTVNASNTRLATLNDIPEYLPNQYALTVKIGSTTVTYDGSSPQTVEIADGTEVSY